ncbi:MAG: poly-beta-1,6-N-acetyl-D-glucosamine N-deacetylase PgaB [Candidatus Eisenbacteria bacterium]
MTRIHAVTAVAVAALLSVSCLASAPRPRAEPLIAVLCYHDIAADTTLPPYTIHPDSLRAHLRRAKANGWTFVPLSRVIAQRAKPGRLPARTMVVTFDDGYRSFKEQALPILRAEGVTATLAIVTSWVDRPPDGVPPLLSWDEIRALDRDGLVEIAAHSHDQHHFVTTNPYGDTEPAVTARQYHPGEERYETRSAYEDRLDADLREAQRVLHVKLGHPVTVLAWPYGEWNTTSRRIARRNNFTTSLGIEGSEVAPESLAAGHLSRVMVYREVPVASPDLSWLRTPRRAVRAAQVDLDDLADPDPGVVDERIARVIARLGALGASHVFLQGVPDPAGDGSFTEAYFMNHQVPVRADLWSMVAHRLARQQLQVWIRVPSPWSHRVSPDIAAARQAAVDFYSDLAVYLPIHGVLFDDDAHLRAGEMRGSPDPAARRDAIRGMIEEIKAGVRAWRPQCRFGRVIDPSALGREGVDPEFAQDAGECVRLDDLVVVPARPGPGEAGDDPAAWAAALAGQASRVARSAGAHGAPILLRFDAHDAATKRGLDGAVLTRMIRGAEGAGIRDVGIRRITPTGGDLPDGLLRADQNPVVRETPQDVRR